MSPSLQAGGRKPTVIAHMQDGTVPSRQRVQPDAAFRAQALTHAMGREIRAARLAAGLSQRDVARAAASSQSRLSHIERSLGANATVVEFSVIANVVGLKLVVNFYPVLNRLRDGPQLNLLETLRTQLPATAGWRSEVPVPIPGDLRALDALIQLGRCRIAVEAWTRLSDVQAQLRSAALKRREAGADRLLVLLADTRHNRLAWQQASPMVRSTLPLETRAIMAALRRGRDPGGDGVALLRIRRPPTAS